MQVRTPCAGMMLLVLLSLAGAVCCGPDPAEQAPAPSEDAVPPGTARSLTPGAPSPEAPAKPARVPGLEEGGDLAALFRQAAELARTGLYERALELYEQILEERPDHAPTLINLARIHFIRGRTEEAIELLERADKVYPGNPRTLAYLGMAEAKAGRLEEALVHLEGSQLIDPTRVDVGNELAGVYFRLERHEEAEEAWDRVLKIDPDNLLARAGLEQVRRQSQPADALPPQP